MKLRFNSLAELIFQCKINSGEASLIVSRDSGFHKSAVIKALGLIYFFVGNYSNALGEHWLDGQS